MSENKWTPGPYCLEWDGDCDDGTIPECWEFPIGISAGSGDDFTIIVDFANSVTEPDARLITAAPELYAALDALYRYCNGDPEMAGMEGYAMNEAGRALAKARGEDDA